MPKPVQTSLRIHPSAAMTSWPLQITDRHELELPAETILEDAETSEVGKIRGTGPAAMSLPCASEANERTGPAIRASGIRFKNFNCERTKPGRQQKILKRGKNEVADDVSRSREAGEG